MTDFHSFPEWFDDQVEFADKDALPALLWIDVETTGLELDEYMLEIAVVGSDIEGKVIRDFWYHSLLCTHTPAFFDRLENLTPIVKSMHEKSGLLREVTAICGNPVSLAETQIFKILNKNQIANMNLMFAGSSVHYDVGFIQRTMPQLYHFMHYRQVNVSTVKELCRGLNPELYQAISDPGRSGYRPMGHHRSIPDLVDSINEYYLYRDNFLIGASNE